MSDTDDRLVWVMNQYRSAEIRGAGVILRLGRLADSSDLRSNFSKHLRDEGVHAWLWTRTIEKLGGEVEDVEDAYQVRLGTNFGLPRSVTELLAVTLVSEERGVATYEEHLAQDVPDEVSRTLRGILKDEVWHVEWIGEELRKRAATDPEVGVAIERARLADEAAMREIAALYAIAPGVGNWSVPSTPTTALVTP